VGGGAAGLSAGVAAARSGAEVTVLESAAALGGTTAISGGAIWVPGNPWAAAHGVVDSVDDGVRYLEALQREGDGDGELSSRYVRDCLGVLGEIEETTGLTWQHMVGFTDYHAELPGGSEGGRGLEIKPIEVPAEAWQQVRPDPYNPTRTTVNEATGAHPAPDDDELERRERSGAVMRGAGLIAALYASLCELGGRALVGHRASALHGDNGAVSGVVANGQTFEGQVVLASGGFERNERLVRTFLRGPLLAPAGPPSNAGDGLLLGMSRGAALGNMSEAWWCPAMHVPGETLDGAPFYRMIFTDCAHPGGLLVDWRGQRFVNESSNYNDLGRGLQVFDPAAWRQSPTWLVFDARRNAERPFGGDVVWSLRAPKKETRAAEPALSRDWLISADSLEGIAKQIEVPPVALLATVERFNAAIDAGEADEFGRGSYAYDRFSQGSAPLRTVGEAPFFALRVLPGSLGTKGGLRSDADGRVQSAQGGPIEGLYAAGNVSASSFANAYPGPGATIGPALFFGWRAGTAAGA
jgi:succinate dehydrogenase/fumarate reductase flavoprotein subunit